ncbi:MAG: hypothetical protein SGILL_010626, partial [Bacillariaceae sp.]
SLRNLHGSTKDSVASNGDDTHKSSREENYAYSNSSNSSLSCSLGEEPILTTVATVVTDGIAVSTFVQSNAATTYFIEDGVVMVEDGSSCYSSHNVERKAAFDYLPEIQDEAEIAALLLDEIQNDVPSLATPDGDDCTDAAIASSNDDVDATDKAVDGAIVDAALEEECKMDEHTINNNLWLCVNNQETIHIAQTQQQPTHEMFVCLTTTWNLCGGGGAGQLSFLSKDDDAHAVMKKKIAMQMEEAATAEESKEDSMSGQAEEKQPEDGDDDSSGMEVALFTAETDVGPEGQPEILQEPQIEPAERRYSIDSFSGDILAEEKLLPRAMEVLAKRQHDLETLDEIEVQVKSSALQHMHRP